MDDAPSDRNDVSRARASVVDKLPRGMVEGSPRLRKVEGRLSEIETKLAGGMLPKQAEKWARDEYQLTRRQAARYVSAIQRLWSDEASNDTEPPAARRARVRRMLYDALSRSYGKTAAAISREGELFEYASPDLNSAARILEMIIRFEGLHEPDRLEHSVKVEHMVPALREFYAGHGLANRSGEARIGPGETVVVEADGDEDEEG